MLINFFCILIAILFLIIGFLAFVINAKNKKIENTKQENIDLIKEVEKEAASYNEDVIIRYNQERKKHEELKYESKKNTIDGFNANIERMQQLEKSSNSN